MPPRRRRPPRGADQGHFGPPGLVGTGEKAKNFKGSFRRLLGQLRPERKVLIVVVLLAAVAVGCQVGAPKVLAKATNAIFGGAISRQINHYAGDVWTKEQVVQQLEAAGQHDRAQMVASLELRPGKGVDFGYVGRIIIIVTAIYLLSSLFAWLQGFLMAGIVQRTVYRLRRDVDTKVARLPLAFFDGRARGDILSRLTNDIDNIQQTMQQVLTQIISSFLTIIGVLGPDVLDQPSARGDLARRAAGVGGPRHGHRQALAEAVHAAVGAHGRSQRSRRGDVHGSQHRQDLRSPERGHRGLRRPERRALRRQLQGPVHLGHHHAGHDVRLEPQLRGRVRAGRPAGGERHHEHRRRHGLHPVRAAVRPADHPGGERGQRAAVGGRLGRAGLRDARRGRGVARSGEAGRLYAK